MLDSTVQGNVTQFLSDFGHALAARDIAAATAMFQDDCYWRDLVSFTWNITTCEGRAAIADMLSHRLADTAPT
jgi:putative flavoprotein involved in K+ transport